MAITPEQNAQLEAIKQTLSGIDTALGSMSAEEKAKFDNSSVASGMKNVFSAVGGVFSDLQVENGVLTSRSAQQAVNNANNVIGSAGTTREKSPMQLLREANAKLQKEFEKQKEVNKELEAKASIEQQRAEQSTATTTGGEGTGQPQVDPTTGQPTTTPDGTPTEATTIPGLENDPVALAMTQAFNERMAITNANIQRLQDFVDAEDEDTKRIIKSLEATAANQTKRIEKENARLAQAARVAGIVAGRGMYSPEEHEGIISEVIQEGLDRVADIENTRDTAIIEAKKAQREFNYKAYVEMSDMVEALSDLKRQTIIDMKDRLIEIETQEREKMRFDQEQADRNAFILAPELMNATSEEIYKAALANGIEPGLLAREVQAYKDEQAMNALDIEGKQQDIALQKERIKSEQYDRYLASLKASGTGQDGVELKPMNKTEQEQFASSYGWTPPFGMSQEEALRIEEMFAGEPSAVKLARAKEIMVGNNRTFVETTAEDIKALANSDEKVQDTIKQISKQLGVKTWLGRGKGAEDLVVDAQMESYIQQAVAEADANGVTLSTRELVDFIAQAVTEDKKLEEAEKKAANQKAKEVAQPDWARTANSTQAVNLK